MALETIEEHLATQKDIPVVGPFIDELAKSLTALNSFIKSADPVEILTDIATALDAVVSKLPLWLAWAITRLVGALKALEQAL